MELVKLYGISSPKELCDVILRETDQGRIGSGEIHVDRALSMALIMNYEVDVNGKIVRLNDYLRGQFYDPQFAQPFSTGPIPGQEGKVTGYYVKYTPNSPSALSSCAEPRKKVA